MKAIGSLVWAFICAMAVSGVAVSTIYQPTWFGLVVIAMNGLASYVNLQSFLSLNFKGGNK